VTDEEDRFTPPTEEAIREWLERPRPTGFTAKYRFEEFLRAAGYRCANLSENIGGACENTPRDRVYLMLGGGEEGTEFRLGCRSEPFVFNKKGNLYLAPHGGWGLEEVLEYVAEIMDGGKRDPDFLACVLGTIRGRITTTLKAEGKEPK
jgi:hypothetical protein